MSVHQPPQTLQRLLQHPAYHYNWLQKKYLHTLKKPNNSTKKKKKKKVKLQPKPTVNFLSWSKILWGRWHPSPIICSHKKIEKGSSSLKFVTHNSLAQTNGRKWQNIVIKSICILSARYFFERTKLRNYLLYCLSFKPSTLPDARVLCIIKFVD